MPRPSTTHTPLRYAPSGVEFVGTLLNDVPLWNPLAGEWQSGPVPVSAVAALTTVRYVDAGTTVPLAEQTGSAVAPFASIQDALNSFPNPTVYGTLLIAPGDYSGEAPSPPATIGIVAFVAIGKKLLTTSPVILGTITLAGSIGLAVVSCQGATINVDTTAAPVIVQLQDCALGGDILDVAAVQTALVVQMTDTTIGGDVGTLAAPASFCEVEANVAGLPNITGGLFLAPFGFASFFGGGVGGTILGSGNGSVAANNAVFGALDALGGLTLHDCVVNGTIGAGTAVNQLEAWDTTFVGDVTLGATSRVRASNITGQWSTPNTVEVDAWTRKQFFDTGLPVLGGGSLSVDERCNQEVVTVALANQLAGELAYYDVVMVAELSTLAVGDPVVVNPLQDLDAAGPGAGHLASARVSAANTVRLAVVGSITAGNFDFLFAAAQ